MTDAVLPKVDAAFCLRILTDGTISSQSTESCYSIQCADGIVYYRQP